jgi:N-acetylglutamate synthase-like GNAT family acetyltransferase
VAGWTWAGVCELRQLWIDQQFRHSGLGTALLDSAIAEARARGCSYVYLATYSFQAPTFYLKFGFKPLAVIADKPLGHSDIIMRLNLTDADDEGCAGAESVCAAARI